MCTAALPVFAGQDDDALKNVTVDLLVDLDPVDESSGFQMRGFTVSPDGKYAYGGFLQNYRHVSKIDTSTGEHVGEYAPEIENDDYDGVVADNNYPKGLAVDCRGYLFVGITHDVPNTSYISIACVDTAVDEDGFMQEISYITENMDTTRVGINGVAAQKIGDKVLLYVVTCYNKDTIRCYDVTDVKNMKLYDGFGVNGVIDYNELTGSQADPGYLTVDVDGYIYLCYLQDNSPNSKGSHVMKIDKDGRSMISQVEVREAYGICTAGDYLFVSTYDNAKSKIVVLNKSDLSTVTEFAYEDQFSPLCGCAYGGKRLYIGDHGDGTSGIPGTILQTSEINLTRDPRETETMEADPTVRPDDETTTNTEQPEQPDGSLLLADFTDPDVVAKIGKGNDCELEYDEINGCLKITVTGADPYFNLPMKKEQFFDGDKLSTLVINYKTDYDYASGEIFFTTKDERNVAANHLTYEMDPAEDFTDLEIDMTEDENGTWGGQVRSIRIDPSTSDDEDQVFYFKSVSIKEPVEVVTEAPETSEPVTTEAPATDAETDAETETDKATDTNKPADTSKVNPPKQNDNNNKGWLIPVIIAAVVVVAAVAVLLVLKSKKKK